MTLRRVFGFALLFLALSLPPAQADDPCQADDKQILSKKALAAMSKAEQAGRSPELFLAYQTVAANDCIDAVDKQARGKAKANLLKLGRELGKAAEAKGVFYSSELVRPDGQTSAFRYYEAIGEFGDANRVMLKAVQAKSEDARLFETAWNVDRSRQGPPDPKTGERSPFNSPATYRKELERLASANADRLMKAEEQDAKGLSGSAADVATSTMKSLDKLRTASTWLKFIPGGDTPAKTRAEQRGDAILKRPDPMFTQASARMYYEFAGSAKAKAVAAQIDKKSEEFQRAGEKAAEKVKGAITQQSEADQKKFDKKKADLEKELGF